MKKKNRNILVARNDAKNPNKQKKRSSERIIKINLDQANITPRVPRAGSEVYETEQSDHRHKRRKKQWEAICATDTAKRRKRNGPTSYTGRGEVD